MREYWFRIHYDIRTNEKVLGLGDYDWRLLSLGLWPLASANRREPGLVGRTRRRGLVLAEFAADLAPIMGSDEGNAGGQIQVVRDSRVSAARLVPALLRLQSAGLIAILRAGADPSCWLSGQESARAERALRQADLLLEEGDFAEGRFQVAVVNWRERQYLEKRHRKPSDSRDRVRARVRRYRDRERKRHGPAEDLDRALAEAVGDGGKPVGNPVENPVKRGVTSLASGGVTPEKRPSNAPVTPLGLHLSRGLDHVTPQVLQITDNREVLPRVTDHFSSTGTDGPPRPDRPKGLVRIRDLLPSVVGKPSGEQPA